MLYEVQVPPSGTMLPIALKIVGYSIKNGFNLEASSPAYQRTVHNRTVPWTEEFHAGICSGFKAIKVWFVLPCISYHSWCHWESEGF